MGKHEIREFDDLKPAPYNPRAISDDAADGLRASLEAFGDISGLTYNRQTGHMVAGHQRLEQLREMGGILVIDDDSACVIAGQHSFPVRVVDWPIEKEQAANLAANNPHIAGAFSSGLDDLLEDVRLGIGDGQFTDLRLDELLSDDSGQPDKEGRGNEGPETSSLTGGVVTEPGDLWVMGRHRLLCGDCTNKKDVARLVESGFEICITSPPYGISDTVQLRDKKPKGQSKTNLYSLYKDKGHEKWRLLMDSWWSVLSPYWVGALVNVQMCADNKAQLIGWMNHRIDSLCDIAIWDKGSAAPASMPGVLNSQFEFIMVFGKQGLRRVPLSTWHADKANVFRHTGVKTQSKHRARMPQPVAEWMVDLCDSASKICDPFAGTGTTMMAADARDKMCVSMELDPEYCDLAVERWEQETGGKAKREKAG